MYLTRKRKCGATGSARSATQCKPFYISDFPSLSASVLGYSEEHHAHLNNTFHAKARDFARNETT